MAQIGSTCSAVIAMLLRSEEPAVRLRCRVDVLGEDGSSTAGEALREAVRRSDRAQTLIAGAQPKGPAPNRAYDKWTGTHWVLVDLADLGYPAGDAALAPLAEQELAWILSADREARTRRVEGRVRQHASQEGNALYALLALGLATPDDPRVERLARRLIEWQWPDGGWNCDRRPDVTISSFFESLTPLRGLVLYANLTGDASAREAVARAAEVFLSRRLFKRRRDGEVMHPQFLQLHYPVYWHYDVLFALKVMAEAGFLHDPRCSDALDLLESKQLPAGGWAAEASFWRFAPPPAPAAPAAPASNVSLVRWGPTGKTRVNEFVTLDALTVLHAAGRA